MMQVNFRSQRKAKEGEAEESILFPEYAEKFQGPGDLHAIGFLQAGTQKGDPSVCLMIEYPRGSGSMIAVETTAGLYLTMAAAMKGTMERWGESWIGA